MFSLKASLVEEIVGWEMRLYSIWRAANTEGLSFHERRQELLQRQFERRRDLWTKSISFLRGEVRSNRSDKSLLGHAQRFRL